MNTLSWTAFLIPLESDVKSSDTKQQLNHSTNNLIKFTLLCQAVLLHPGGERVAFAQHNLDVSSESCGRRLITEISPIISISFWMCLWKLLYWVVVISLFWMLASSTVVALASKDDRLKSARISFLMFILLIVSVWTILFIWCIKDVYEQLGLCVQTHSHSQSHSCCCELCGKTDNEPELYRKRNRN